MLSIFQKLIFYQRTCKLVTVGNMMETDMPHKNVKANTAGKLEVKVPERSSILVMVRGHIRIGDTSSKIPSFFSSTHDFLSSVSNNLGLLRKTEAV